MTVTISKAGPYYSSGEIKFSSLRSNFRAQVRKETSGGSETFNSDTAEIKVSELRRVTITSNNNPIVPDATENANITTSSNWKASQFRNSIKYYYITQSGTNLNFDIGAQSWNNNLDKNVCKFLFVDGTCGSNNPTLPAAKLNTTTVNNLTVDVYGSILGSAGLPGKWDLTYPINGGTGGDALEMTFTSGSNNKVLVRTTTTTSAKIYGGGGGGGKGAKGADGTGGTCRIYERFQTGCQEGSNQCPGGWTQYGSGNSCCRWDRGCAANIWWKDCYYDYSISGGIGGDGGMGGIGRGYNNQLNSLIGLEGDLGTAAGTCSSGGSAITVATDGEKGYQGGYGGDWGSPGLAGYWSGSPPIPPSSGGNPGRAIFRSSAGASYTVSGVINSDTIKGSYK